MKTTEDLVKNVENLKNEKSVLTAGIFKLKKISDDLKKKNYEKGEALKSIRNFFLTSTVFKLKNLAEIEESKANDKDSLNLNDNSYKK
jgi:hypothetical protein